MFTIGDDFQYMNAAQNFLNWDKMIKYFNSKYKTSQSVKLLYSTPSCFMKALLDEQQLDPTYQWPVKNDDFFPYADST